MAGQRICNVGRLAQPPGHGRPRPISLRNGSQTANFDEHRSWRHPAPRWISPFHSRASPSSILRTFWIPGDPKSGTSQDPSEFSRDSESLVLPTTCLAGASSSTCASWRQVILAAFRPRPEVSDPSAESLETAASQAPARHKARCREAASLERTASQASPPQGSLSRGGPCRRRRRATPH